MGEIKPFSSSQEPGEIFKRFSDLHNLDIYQPNSLVSINREVSHVYSEYLGQKERCVGIVLLLHQTIYSSIYTAGLIGQSLAKGVWSIL